MVLTERVVGEVVPIEHARRESRTVLQWDKADCAWTRLVRFDLLAPASTPAREGAMGAGLTPPSRRVGVRLA